MTVTMLAPSPATLALRPYQRDAAEAFRAGTRRGLRRMLVEMATGLVCPRGVEWRTNLTTGASQVRWPDLAAVAGGAE